MSFFNVYTRTSLRLYRIEEDKKVLKKDILQTEEEMKSLNDDRIVSRTTKDRFDNSFGRSEGVQGYTFAWVYVIFTRVIRRSCCVNNNKNVSAPFFLILLLHINAIVFYRGRSFYEFRIVVAAFD